MERTGFGNKPVMEKAQKPILNMVANQEGKFLIRGLMGRKKEKHMAGSQDFFILSWILPLAYLRSDLFYELGQFIKSL